MAGLALWVDTQLAEETQLPLTLAPTVSGGRAIATTVAGATITVAAIVFSITALSTQMAASQYSPRALGSFFEDPFQQWIIGLVVGTFTYSLLILAGLGAVIDTPASSAPSVSVTLSILFGVMSAIGIVAYINHSLRRMQIDSVVRRIADAAVASIRAELEHTEETAVPEASPPQGKPTSVTSDRSGWVTDIDTETLIGRIPAGLSVRIDVRVGEAVTEGDLIARMWPDSADLTGVEKAVRRSIELASKRSVSTDPTFGIRQLVDIALRALSPGVNDPTTAVDVLYHLKLPVREVLVSDPPRRVFLGADDRRVYLAERPSRSDYVHMAFSEIRLAASSQLAVIEALIDVLTDLRSELEGAHLGSRAASIGQELELTVEMARKSPLPDEDLRRVVGADLMPEDD